MEHRTLRYNFPILRSFSSAVLVANYFSSSAVIFLEVMFLSLFLLLALLFLLSSLLLLTTWFLWLLKLDLTLLISLQVDLLSRSISIYKTFVISILIFSSSNAQLFNRSMFGWLFSISFDFQTSLVLCNLSNKYNVDKGAWKALDFFSFSPLTNLWRLSSLWPMHVTRRNNKAILLLPLSSSWYSTTLWPSWDRSIHTFWFTRVSISLKVTPWRQKGIS